MDENNQNPPGTGGGTGSTGSMGSSTAASGSTSTAGTTTSSAGAGSGIGGATNISGGRADEAGEARKIDRAREFAQEKYKAASSAVRDQYTAVRQRVDEVDVSEVTDKAREYVRANPGKALLFSVAAGFVVGLLFRQSDED